ncbi:MAG: hypothetical protein COB04_02485 [Gammaproteobacteria bacterium]|nr:MAG: hypothetical protein COB04_02485 [Gammaproteobacteria bacterium]
MAKQMIIKEKLVEGMPANRMLKAGIEQEQDVAFYLRREFKNRDDVIVLNDLRLIHDDEVAQIDHLVVTKLGFCLIESKSIRAQVFINQQGEWSRKYGSKLTGIKSPIQQVELQQKLLLALLSDHVGEMLGKLFGLLRKGVARRKWTSICAVSSDAVINRKYLPNDLSERVIKSEFVAGWVDKNMTHGQGYGATYKKYTSGEALFSDVELKSIGDFLLDRHRPIGGSTAKTNPTTNEKACTEKTNKSSVARVIEPIAPSETKDPSQKDYDASAKSAPEDIRAAIAPTLCCKSCQQTDKLTAKSGRYGYYVLCECGANTSMKTKCIQCSKAMSVSKSVGEYKASCDCGYSLVVYSETKDTA